MNMNTNQEQKMLDSGRLLIQNHYHVNEMYLDQKI